MSEILTFDAIFNTTSLLYALGIFGANIVQGLAGFAGSLLAMPPSMELIGFDTAKVAVNTYGLISSATVFISVYKHIVWKEAFLMLFLMCIGLTAGIWLSDVINQKILFQIFGIFLILVALKEFFYKGNIDFNAIALIIIILCAGTIQGLFLSGGPLLVIYAAKKLKETHAIRGTLCFMWVFVNGYMMASQIYKGQFTPEAIKYTLIGLPFVFLGVWVGGYLAHRISRDKFLKVVYVLLILTGVSMLIKNL